MSYWAIKLPNSTVESNLLITTKECIIKLSIDFSDVGAYWLREYESDTIKEDFKQMYETLAPLYKQIHAYARAKLRKIYPDQISSDGLIPAHLLGRPEILR